jgi:Tfp pilus assembly protein PilV
MCTLNLPHQYSLHKQDVTFGTRRQTIALQTGFGLIEILIALLIMTFGLLAVGQLIYMTTGTGSLARSKGTTVTAAQSKLESLSDLYRRNPDSVEMSAGMHGPELAESLNPATGVALDRFEITWNVGNVPDPRPGKTLQAKLVSITVTPARSGGGANTKPLLNRVLNLSTVISRKKL